MNGSKSFYFHATADGFIDYSHNFIRIGWISHVVSGITKWVWPIRTVALDKTKSEILFNDGIATVEEILPILAEVSC